MKLFYVLPALLVSASMIACAVQGNGEDEGASANAVSVSPNMLRWCAAAATYVSDGPNDLDTPPDSSLPAAVAAASARQNSPAMHFKAPVAGDVFAIGGDGDGTFVLYDINGRVLAMASADPSDPTDTLNWWDQNNNPLDCSKTSYNVKSSLGSSSSSSSGWSSSSSGWSSSGDVDGGTDNSSSSSGWVTDDDGGTDNSSGWVTVDAGATDN